MVVVQDVVRLCVGVQNSSNGRGRGGGGGGGGGGDGKDGEEWVLTSDGKRLKRGGGKRW